MRDRMLAFAGALVVAGVVASLGLVAVEGQTQVTRAPAAAAKPYTPPRTADGKVDLQGVYDTSTLTPLERPTADVHMTDEEAKRVEAQTAARRERASLPSNASRQAPPVGGDGSSGAAGNVGGYNNFWIDSGDTVVVINGRPRTSIVVDPPDGRIPRAARTAGRGFAPAAAVAPTSDAAENVVTAARGAYDNPEQRPLGERCLMGFGSTSGPPALPVLYNNFKQIVQTPEHVMILTEMNHDVRIVRMNQPHRPKSIRMWLGDPVGHWEGDTLVVDTTNFTEKTRYGGSSPDLHIVERFSRLDDKTLLYRFTVEDPGPNSPWSKPWSGEYTWRLAAPDDHLYEYACHEGNYALGDILRGERLLEKEAEEAAKQR